MLSSRWFTILTIIFVLACGSYSLFIYTQKAHALTPRDFLNCFSKDGVANNTCLQSTSGALLKTYKTRVLMNYIVATSSPSQLVANCHSIAHAIGEETFARSKNLESALNACTDQCNLGCAHGAIVESMVKDIGMSSAQDLAHADTNRIEQIGAQYCDKSINACHAVGHVAYANLGDMPKTLKLCDRVASSTAASTCYLGTFMEAFQSNFGSSSSAYQENGHIGDLAYPCDTLSSSYQHACFLYLPLVRRQQLASTTPRERMSAWRSTCSALKSAKLQSDCFMGFGMRYERYVDRNGAMAANNGVQCSTLKGTNRNSCVIGVALSYAPFGDGKDALTYCSTLENPQEQSLCYNASFLSIERSELNGNTESICDTVPNKAECHYAYAYYLKVALKLPDYYGSGIF